VRTVRLDAGLHRTDADNGVVVLSETLPAVRSVAVGIWVRAASAHEDARAMGVSHLLEHMVFKGTERRTARDIALELESRGGTLDAFTSRDHTSYQARVLDADLPRAVDVLTDLVLHPTLRAEDFELERNVVLEEIGTVEDTPDDLVFDLHAETLWPDHAYGYSILGTRATVGGMRIENLRGLHARAYHPGHVVIAAAGCVTHDALLKLLTQHGWFTRPAGPALPAVPAASPRRGCTRRVPRDGAQTHVVLGTDTFPYRDVRRHALLVLVNVLGGGMSSRLFQRVREELGLAYSVFAFQSFYRDGGTAGVYVGTQPARAAEAVGAIEAELARVAAEGLGAADLADAKQQLKGQVTLALENPAARMYRLAGFPLHELSYRSIDDTLRDIDAVSLDDVAGVAAEFFLPGRQTAVWLGPP
jgi:predicted Zn-dependent peptidase